MNSRDLISLCVRNLLRRRTRTLLAVVGVVVGTCAIVVMLSIGFGLSVGFQEQIESQGNLHLVNVRSNGGMAMAMNSGGNSSDKKAVLDMKTITKIEKIPGVDAASPQVSEYMTFAIGKYIAQSEVIGMRPEVMQKFGYELKEGRLLQPGDKNAVIFGNQVPSWFFNPKKTQGSSWGGEPQVNVITNKMMITGDSQYGQKRPQQDPNEEKIDYTEYKVKGVGILANENDQSAWSTYMSLEMVETIQKDLKKARKESSFGTMNKGYDKAVVYVGDINQVEEVSKTIREMGFQTDSMNDWLKQTQKTAAMIQGILGGIGAISLLVAALGITNTMIMSIYERTKEIGVMKVIGSNLKDIQKMFLLEAALIGFFGGVAGLAISYLVSLMMNTILLPIMSSVLNTMGGGGSVVSIIPWWVAIGSVAFATIIGVMSGYYPARRAMNLSALESLKNE